MCLPSAHDVRYSTKQCGRSAPPAVISVHHNFLHVLSTRNAPCPRSCGSLPPPRPFMSTSPPCTSATAAPLLFGRFAPDGLCFPLCLYLRVHFSVKLLRLCQSWMSQAVTVCHGWCAMSEIITQDIKRIAACSRGRVVLSRSPSASPPPVQEVIKVHWAVNKEESKTNLFYWNTCKRKICGFRVSWLCWWKLIIIFKIMCQWAYSHLNVRILWKPRTDKPNISTLLYLMEVERWRWGICWRHQAQIKSQSFFFTDVSSPLYHYQAQKRQESRFVDFVNGTLASVPS